MLTDHSHGFAVNTDGAGPAAFGGAFDTLAAHDGGRPAKGYLGGVEIQGVPAKVEQFAASCAVEAARR